ncbi:MAG: MBL fold metallo-hydrolase [Chloroflexi bacterium]|nr:MBL fold metallo-hydrolase [Chloroflexota bacterium]
MERLEGGPPYLHCVQLPTPFVVGPVNIYVALGSDGVTLVDTGPKTTAARAALVSGLIALGQDAPAIGQVVVTHAHADHYGLAGWLAGQGGAAVATHPLNQGSLAQDAAVEAQHAAFYEEQLTLAGVPQELRQGIEAVRRGFRAYVERLPDTRPLVEGDALCLGGEPWQALHLPGHSGGLLGLWQADRRVLLASDHLLQGITSNPLLEPPAQPSQPRRRSLADYLESLERTRQLQPALVLPGHGPPIVRAGALIDERLRFHERRQEWLWRRIAMGVGTVYGLCLELFGALSELNTLLAVSEVVGHLDLLQAAGRIGWATRDGLWRLWAR